MAVSTADEFRRVLETSGILTNAQFERALQVAGEEADLRHTARSLIRENLITTWQARQLLAGVTGLKLGKYKLLDELGRSELGRVYLAEHQQLGRRAALKLLSRELSSRAETLEQFLGDARSIAGLDHPHLVHTLDVAHEGERYYIVFEYVEGRNLSKLVEEAGAIPAPQAVEYLRQAADGLSHAHAHGVLHGDLKPGNFILDPRGHIKILDLGVARLSSSAHALSRSNGSSAVLAEEAFRAPELNENPEAVSTCSDIYSLGMALFCLLTGQLPSSPDPELGLPSTSSLLTQLAVLCPNLPDDLVAICSRMLAQNPAERFQSAAELRELLAGWLQHREQQLADAPPAETAPGARDSANPAHPAKPGRTTAAPRTPAAKSTGAAASSSYSSSSIDIAGDAQAATESLAEEAKREEKPSQDAGASPVSFVGSSRRPGVRQPRGGAAMRFRSSTSAGSAAEASQDAAHREPHSTPADRRPGRWRWKASGCGAALAACIAVLIYFSSGDDSAKQVADSTTNAQSVAGTPVAGTPVAEPRVAPRPLAAAAPQLATQSPAAPEPPTREKPTPNPETAPPVASVASAPAPMPPVPMSPAPPAPSEPEAKPPTAAVASTPAPAPSPPPAPSPAPPADPFAEFAAKFVALPLPGPDGLSPVALGRLQLPKNGPLIVHLLGGDVALRGKSQFQLDATSSGASDDRWDVYLHDGAANSQPAASQTSGNSDDHRIARLFLQDEQLWFQWTSAAAANPAAPHLINCVLEMTAGDKSRLVALRKTIEADPLKADVFKGPNRARWDVPFAPNYDRVKVEVAFEGPFEPIKYEGAMPFDVEKGKAFAWFGAKPEDQIWCYRVDTQLRKQLEVVFEAQMRTTPMGRLERLQPNRITQLYNKLVADRTRLSQRTETVRALAGQTGEDGKQLLLQHEQALELMQHWSQRLQKIAELGEQLPNVGRLHVRAYYEVEGKQYDLFRTTDFPAAEPTK